MPRIARDIVVGVPYHITQRGNRRQEVFFTDADRLQYLSHLKDYSERYGLNVLAYCLMTNHVHLVAIPLKPDSLALTLRTVHMRHSQMINAEFGWSGHLWQGRYFSCALDDPHLWAAVRYVERNPVRARIIDNAGNYPWSSAAHHLGLRKDTLISGNTIWTRPVDEWDEALREPQNESVVDLLRTRTRTGFPCGGEDFIKKLSEILGKPLLERGRGRPKNQ